MAKPVYEVRVLTGSYERNGERKNAYMNVGAVFKGRDGDSYFMRLSRWFNPAGVPSSSDDGIILYFAKPENNTYDRQGL